MVKPHRTQRLWTVLLLQILAALHPSCSSGPSSNPATPTTDRFVPSAPVRIGHPGAPSFKGTAVEITNHRLQQQGWDVESVFFTQTDLAAAALAQGTTQFLLMQSLDPLRTIDRGADVRWVLENNAGEFVLVAPAGASTCRDLEGLSVVNSNQTSNNSINTEVFLRRNCGLDPAIQYVQEGEARVAALLAGHADVTFIQLADFMVLEREAPGRFAIFPTGNTFENSGAGLWINGGWAEQNRPTARAYVIELLRTYRMIAEDPGKFEADVLSFHPELDRPTATRMIEVYRELGAFPVNGGDGSILASALDRFTPLGEISEALKVESIQDTHLLAEALQALGRIEGRR